MIERIGSEPFIRNFGALKAHEDETGIFSPADRRPAWKLGMVVHGGENGTPATDGCVDHFYLPVPGTLTTAREAVGWTYDMSPAEHAIALRT